MAKKTGGKQMSSLPKAHIFYLRKITRSETKLPGYHKLARNLAAKGYIRFDGPDDLGEYLVKITPKGRQALEAASPRPYPAADF